MQLKKLVKWLPILLLAVLSIGVYAWREYHREQESTEDLTIVFTKTANEIVQEFEKSESTANSLYNDKVLAINGKIVQINTTDTTQQIILAGPVSSGGVICDFESNERSKIKALTVGSEVKVVGVCTGFLMDVVMVRCILKTK
jgi:uncharacterized membrane protein